MKNIILIMLCMVFLTSFASAVMEWDNVKDYDAEKREITITNALGFGDDIAKIQLKTKQIHRVMPGQDRLVAEMYFENYDDYDNVFNDMEFLDIKQGGSEIIREFKFKYRTQYEVVQPHYETTCGLTPDTCVTIQKGTNKHTKQLL